MEPVHCGTGVSGLEDIPEETALCNSGTVLRCVFVFWLMHGFMLVLS